MSNIMSAKILRHIADLHEAGIMSDQAKVDEEEYEYCCSGSAIEKADLSIAVMSYFISDYCSFDNGDMTAAIAKNQRHLDWMEANPDPTKTPLELWEEAKVALVEVDNV